MVPRSCALLLATATAVHGFFGQKADDVPAGPPPGIALKKASVALPVVFLAVLLLIKGTTPPVFKPQRAWRIVMGVVSFMYIVAFWLPAEAMHIFFTVEAEPHELIKDNKLWGFFALASINWLATTSLLFLFCSISSPCPTRLLELALFCFAYNIRGHLVMLMGWGSPEGAVTLLDAAGDIVPIWTAMGLSLWQYAKI